MRPYLLATTGLAFLLSCGEVDDLTETENRPRQHPYTSSCKISDCSEDASVSVELGESISQTIKGKEYLIEHRGIFCVSYPTDIGQRCETEMFVNGEPLGEPRPEFRITVDLPIPRALGAKECFEYDGTKILVMRISYDAANIKPPTTTLCFL